MNTTQKAMLRLALKETANVIAWLVLIGGLVALKCRIDPA